MSTRPLAPDRLLDAAANGDRVSLARLLSIVERGGQPSGEVARLVYASAPPYTIGVTGAPGSGKSTLTNQLVVAARRGWPPAGAREGIEPVDKVGVLAIDPSSPFSGGAILGDRVRMQQHATDPSVFIRSMATRGHLGGLALAVPEAVRVLGAAGFPLVIVETVGVGQMEVEVASAADTTVVVVTPGWGDAMQANKAGLLEIADLFVVNKADRPGVNEARRDLEQMLDLSALSDWRPPVLATAASTGEGIDALWEAVARHRSHLMETGELRRRREARLAQELQRVLTARVLADVHALATARSFEDAVGAIAAGRLDPYRAAERLLAATLAESPAERLGARAGGHPAARLGGHPGARADHRRSDPTAG
ncbi:MAG: methylmalonyl Co-A mutase-associated GTPase MeaB [Actinomycetota bacterium]|nr:methylmalonyl Co-A mutase-associated GTPase MeaB [Actinomycetota bacterium]